MMGLWKYSEFVKFNSFVKKFIVSDVRADLLILRKLLRCIVNISVFSLLWIRKVGVELLLMFSDL